MSTIYMSQLSTLPLMEGEPAHAQDQGLFPAFHVSKDPPILFPFMITNPAMDQLQEGQSSSYGDQHLRQQVFAESTQQFTDRMMLSGSDIFPRPPLFPPTTIPSVDGDMIQRSGAAYDPYDIESKQRADGWAVAAPPPPAAAKMKIMRKATSEYPEGGTARKPRRRAQAHQDAEGHQQQQQVMGVVRVCSDCNTTKTPLWRSGPCGPKSLCNACGIRQRKARRAMAAAAAASNGGTPQAASVAAQATKASKTKEKRADVDRSLPFKKRCKMVAIVDHAAVTAAKATPSAVVAAAPTTKDQDHVVSTSADDKQVAAASAATSLQSKAAASPPRPAAASLHAFPADEVTDAAMLLMTLSCGLVRS